MATSESENYSSDSDNSKDDVDDSCPLQLVEVVNTSSNSYKLVLNEKSLETVLQSTEGHPLAIITVVGPPCLGKSFLLNYIKRGLESKESGNKDTIGRRQLKSHEISGFPWKIHKPSACTKGIWIWGRAFLLDGEDSKIAVILLDTQGLDKTSVSSDIFGLAFLSSSVLIYNAREEDCDIAFSLMSTYFKFGLLCFENDDDFLEDETPFQRICFLFRDWVESENYEYGEPAGNALLGEKVASLRKRLKKGTREGFKKCFEQVGGFLIASAVSEEHEHRFPNGFRGSIAELDVEFLNYFEKFVSSVIKTRNLSTKKILGTEIVPSDFAHFLQQYVHMFNSIHNDEHDSAIEDFIYDTTCAAFHQNIITNALSKYNEIFNKKTKGRKFKNKQDLQDAHEAAAKQANSLFKKSNKLREFSKEYDKKLKNEIKATFDKLTEENQALRNNFIKHCLKTMEETFKSEIHQQFPYVDSSSQTIYGEDIILQTFGQIKNALTEEFLANLAEVDENEDVSHFKQILHESMEETLRPILQHNQRNEEFAKGKLRDLETQLVSNYHSGMNEIIDDGSKTDARILHQCHKLQLKNAKVQFDMMAVEGPFKETFRHQLFTILENAFADIQSKLSVISEQNLEKVETLFTAKAEAYSTAFSEIVEKNGIEDEDPLKTLHADKITKALEMFNLNCNLPPTSPQSENLSKNLKDSMDDVYEKEVNHGVVSQKQKMQEAAGNLLQLYEDEMNRKQNGAEFLEERLLQTAHNQCSKKALEAYKNTNGIKLGDIDEFKMKLESKFKKLKTDNERNAQIAETDAETLFNKCLKSYENEMQEIEASCQDKTDYKQAHERTRTATLAHFETSWKPIYKYLQNDYKKNLEAEMESIFVDLLSFFEIKQSKDVAKAETLKETARSCYHEEMKKHFDNNKFIQPEELQNLHLRSTKAAIEKCKGQLQLNPTHISTLTKMIELSYNKYKDENDIKLNYESGTEPAIGIDLGTTYCCVAVLMKGKVEIIRNLQGKNTTPSYVTVNQNGSVVTGQAAKTNAYKNFENTIFDAKRMIGRRFEDETLQNDMNFWPFTVVKGEEGPAIQVGGNQYPPEQIASFLLRQLVTDAEKYLGKPVTKAVITVPAYFTDGQRQATFDAGELAGLEVLTILNEPTAAAIAYKLERFHEDARNVLVYDLGGGTFDVALLKTDGGNIEILAVDGDTHLGGEDFDKAMMQHCANEFKISHGLDPFEGKDSSQKQERDQAKQRLRRLQSLCEEGKSDLSFAPSATITMDGFYNKLDLDVEVTKEKFEELNDTLFKKTIEIVERALASASLKKELIDDIVLVGGSTRIPKVQELLVEFFNGKALNYKVNPDEAVAYGAAVKAALLNGDQGKKMFNFTSIQDVTPMSLGIEAHIDGIEGQFSTIIPKSSKIPIEVTEDYRTFRDNQDSVRVKIYQGENPMAKHNNFLGEFVLSGIPLNEAGNEIIEVKMKIDDTGILHVTAICKSTKGTKSLSVSENKGRLSKETKRKLLNEFQAVSQAGGMFQRGKAYINKLVNKAYE